VNDVFVRRLRQSVLAAGALLAGVVTSAAIRAWIKPVPAPDARSPQLAALVAAVGTRRSVEPRVTGGFAYASLSSSSRSAARSPDDSSPDIRIAVAQIEKLQARQRSPDTLALLGLAYVAVGDAARAVPLLEEAASVPSTPARVLSDLAAAYLVRALEPSGGQDLAKALDAAGTATRAEASLPEARFNLALALERLHLTTESQQAWQEYLRLDASSAWASEARSHLIVLDAARARSREEERRAIESAAESSDRGLRTRTIEMFTPSARDWTEDQLLAAWPEAHLSGDRDAAAQIVRRASSIAGAVADVTNDRYLADIAASVERAQRGDVTATDLARSHTTFRVAMNQYENNVLVESGRTFEALRRPLERAGSPLASTARLQVAISAYFAGDIEPAGDELDRLIRVVTPLRYGRLLGQLHRMRGLTESVRGRFGHAFDHNARALEVFQAAGDRESVAAIESSLAETLEFLGEPRLAWTHRANALRGLPDVRNPRRRHTLLISSVLSCLRMGSPQAAAYFQSAVLDNARRWNRPEALAEAHVRQAELHGQTGDFANVSADLAEAKRWLSLTAPGPVSRQIEARAMLASASFASRANSMLDEAALTEALEYLRKTGLNWALAKAYLGRGKAYAGRGRIDLAEADFLAGIDEFEKQRASITDEALRVSYFDQPWDLFTEMVRLQTTIRRRPDVALSFAERGRARTLLEAIVRSSEAMPLDVAAIQARLEPDTAIIYYAVLDYEVVVWRLTHARLESFEASIAEADLARLVNRFRAEISETSSRLADSAAHLYDILVRPALRDLPAGATIVFVPDGVLNALPFAALIDRGTGRYLIQDRSIAVAPSASVLIGARAAERARPRVVDRTVLVIGNPRTASVGIPAAPDLPEAAREAADVAGLYSSAEVATALEATKKRFLDDFDKHDVVHFAGHAISNTEFPALSRLVFGAVGEGASDSLFAHELARWRVRRVQVLVLAACQTSSGRIRRGEGVLSLARPFLAAGVPTVVASLWDADDRAAHALLVAFHAALREGAPPADALRSAQLSALASSDADLRLPVKWAGFVVVGSGGSSGH